MNYAQFNKATFKTIIVLYIDETVVSTNFRIPNLNGNVFDQSSKASMGISRLRSRKIDNE